MNARLLLPLTHILQVPGKKFNGKLAHAFNHWMKIPGEKVTAVGEIVDMLQNASLLIDDIQDQSTLRQGFPVAHIIYGVPSTINAANYATFLTLEKVLSLNHPKAALMYTEELLDLYRGQGTEIFWRDNYSCPTEDEYRKMVIQKTGGLFVLVVRLMTLFSKSKEDFTKLARTLGLYHQIQDDYCSLCSQEYTDNKGYCEDLTEGKFSFPVIHAIRSKPDDLQVIRILRQRTDSVEVKQYCVHLLEKFGSLSYTRKVLSQLDKDVRAEVRRFGGNPLMDAVLDALLSWEHCTSSPIEQ